MAEKGLYNRIYTARIAAAVEACRTVERLSHNGEKGRIREILLSSLFRPLLPSDLGVGTGFVISATGQVSPQTDVILYDRSVLPPAMFDESVGLYPIESVLYTIEIKSKLDRAGLLAAHNAAEEVARFTVLGPDSKPVVGPRVPRATLLALDSDLAPSGKSEADRYAEVVGPGPSWLCAFCVVGRGYWWKRDDVSFHSWPELDPYAEVVGFLGGIMNSLPAEFAIRRTLRPALGSYLIDFAPELSEFARKLDALKSRVAALDPGALASTRSELLAEFEPLQAELEALMERFASSAVSDIETVQVTMDAMLTYLRQKLGATP